MKTISSKVTISEVFRALASLALLLGVLSVLSGCGKKDEPAQPTAPETNQAVAAPAPAPAAASRQPAPAADLPPAVQANGEPDLGEMNRNLLRWMMRNQRRPNSFEDFAATAGMPIPPPPAGKKYIIGKDMRIQLVSQ